MCVLLLDPRTVRRRSRSWRQAVVYFGIPLLSVLGLSLAVGVATALLRPGDAPARSMLIVYAAAGLPHFTGQLFFRATPGPAIAGGSGVGVLAMLAWHIAPSRYEAA